MRKIRVETLVPLLLLALLLVVMLITVFTQASNYGLTIDEELQDRYGHSVLAWYTTFGHDQSFLTGYNREFYMPEHGAIFEVVVAAAQDLFGPGWQTRAIVTGLAGVVGVIAIALCGYELGGLWLALIAALGLWLYPRFYGSIFNNSKDIPFAAAMALILWAVLRLFRQWEVKRTYIGNSILVGFFIGLAAAIRVGAVIWYGLLACVLVAWWIRNGRRMVQEQQWRVELKKQMIAAVVIGVVSSVTMILLWPYIFLDPVGHLLQSIQIMNHYPLQFDEIFAGDIFPSTQPPFTYVPGWLIVGSPPAIVILAIIGTWLAVSWYRKMKVGGNRLIVVVLALLLPLMALVISDSTLYDGPRQFFFLVPPLVLLAAYGLMRLWTFFWTRKKVRVLALALALLTLASYGLVIKDMIELHPYEYVYFNPIVGGVAGAQGNYDLDYWAICTKPAAEWLAKNYRYFSSDPNPSVFARPYTFQVLPYLPQNFRDFDTVSQKIRRGPDFFISTTRGDTDQQYYRSYTVIHTESLQGVPLCVVKTRA